MAIGNAAKMIDGGAWQTFPQPHLPKSKNCYKVLYRIGFEYKGFRFLGEYLQDKEDRKNSCWFVFPKYSEFFGKKFIIFSDIVKIENNWQRNIYDISLKNMKLQKLLNTFRESNVFYSDDLCGTDFKQVIDFKIKL